MSAVAVVGAGPAGLSAALAAAEVGHDVVVFEAAPVVGGMAGSFSIAGQRVDFGSHRLHASTAPRFMQRLRTLLGDDLQARERNGRIRLRDRWVGFPLRVGDMVRHLPLDFGARVAIETVGAPLRRGGGDGFMDDVRRRLGPTVLAEFYEPYARKLYGVDPGALSGELARRRVAASSPLEILRSALRARTVDGRTFYYPRRGYGQVAEALAEAAVAAGVDLRLDTPVIGLRPGPGPVVATDAATVAVDHVLSSMPIPVLASALGPAVPSPVAEAIGLLETRAMTLVYLVVPRPRYTAFDAHYFPSLDISISRLSEPKNYRDGDDPADRTVLCAELPCTRGDHIWTASDGELAHLVAADLDRAGLPAADAVEVVVRRLGSVYPVYERATEAARAMVDAWAAGIDGVVSFGRQGLGVPDNLHHVMAMGDAAADAIEPAGGIDRRRWAQSLRTFSGHVVVD